MPALSLSKRNVEQIEALCQLGAEPLKVALAELSKSKEVFIRLEDLSSFAGKHMDKESAGTLVTQLLHARRFADKYQITVAETLDALEEDLIEKGWKEDKLERWRAIKPSFQALAENEKIEIVTKASALFYGHLYHLHSVSITTQTKPLFNETRKSVIGSIIENKLFLTYSDGGENETNLEISLTYDELRRFREVADRAISKTDVLRDYLENTGLVVRVFDSEH